MVLVCGLSFAQQKTFTNPLLASGADPYSTYHEGYYYYIHTQQNRLVLWKTKNLAHLKAAEKTIIWTPPENTMYSKELWAPEVHMIDGNWYVYFAADDGDNNNHRMYVLENTSGNPMNNSWKFKGKLATPSCCSGACRLLVSLPATGRSGRCSSACYFSRDRENVH